MNFTDPTGLKEVRGTSPNQSKKDEFSDIVRGLVGTTYESGGSTSTGLDCSGTIIYALNEMGYDVDDVSVSEMASGDVDWITTTNKVDNSKQGDSGTLNFYDWGQGVEHVNVGVGQKSGETTKQVVDATETDWMVARNSNPNQIIPAGSGQLNQTYTPYSTNSDPSLQGQINFNKLKKDPCERNGE